jgi:hypothetical protein
VSIHPTERFRSREDGAPTKRFICTIINSSLLLHHPSNTLPFAYIRHTGSVAALFVHAVLHPLFLQCRVSRPLGVSSSSGPTAKPRCRVPDRRKLELAATSLGRDAVRSTPRTSHLPHARTTSSKSRILKGATDPPPPRRPYCISFRALPPFVFHLSVVCR